MTEIDSFLFSSPGAIVVSRPACGGKRIGAHIEVDLSYSNKKLGGVVVAFYNKDRKKTTYKNSIGAIVRKTTYGCDCFSPAEEFVDICWE